MKKLVLNCLKIGISTAIIAYLMAEAIKQKDFAELAKCGKHWDMLAGAAALCFLSVCVTLVRWYYLMRALNLPVTFRETLRVGFLGYLFNLSPFGMLGGDVLKCVMLGRHHAGHRAEMAATVFLDRLIGLYVLFLVAAVAILATGYWDTSNVEIRTACHVTWIMTAIGTIAMATLMTSRLTQGRLSAWLARIPGFGDIAQRLTVAVGMYRNNPGVMIGSVLLTVIVHCSNAAGIYLIARGLYEQAHTLEAHLVMTPLAFVTGVVPLSIGPFEWVLGLLYAATPLADGSSVGPGRGLVIALGYRFITLLIAAVGIGYYLASRQEVAEVLHSAEQGESAA